MELQLMVIEFIRALFIFLYSNILGLMPLVMLMVYFGRALFTIGVK